MAVDNTHTKYLHGTDKKVWNNYKEAFEAQNKLDNFLSGMSVPHINLKEGEVVDIPMRPQKNKNNTKK